MIRLPILLGILVWVEEGRQTYLALNLQSELRWFFKAKEDDPVFGTQNSTPSPAVVSVTDLAGFVGHLCR